jgi:2-dehydropantoate 2-reductase
MWIRSRSYDFLSIAIVTSQRGAHTVVADSTSSLSFSHFRNCTWNSLTTVTRLRTGVYFETSPQALILAEKVMVEVTSIARAKGLVIPDGTIPRLMKQCRDAEGKDPLGLPSSMMFDCLNGRGMEVESILGGPMREGLRLGVECPTLLT